MTAAAVTAAVVTPAPADAAQTQNSEEAKQLEAAKAKKDAEAKHLAHLAHLRYVRAQAAARKKRANRATLAVTFAKAHVGDSYGWGGHGPHKFDCSGLTMAAWKQAGISLPHQAKQQYRRGHHVSKSALRPGDIVFFYHSISHVGIYIGNGRMVHAANPREDVRIDNINRGYWAHELVGAVRLV